MFTLYFTRNWATPLYHKWGRGIVSTQCLSCVLHLFGRYHTWGQGIVSIQCLHCVAHTWVIPGYHKWGQGIVSAQCLHWVLHAFEWHLGTINGAEGLVSTQSLYGVRHAFDRHQETIGEVQGPGRVAAPWACHPPSPQIPKNIAVIPRTHRVLSAYSQGELGSSVCQELVSGPGKGVQGGCRLSPHLANIRPCTGFCQDDHPWSDRVLCLRVYNVIQCCFMQWIKRRWPHVAALSERDWQIHG